MAEISSQVTNPIQLPIKIDINNDKNDISPSVVLYETRNGYLSKCILLCTLEAKLGVLKKCLVLRMANIFLSGFGKMGARKTFVDRPNTFVKLKEVQPNSKLNNLELCFVVDGTRSLENPTVSACLMEEVKHETYSCFKTCGGRLGNGACGYRGLQDFGNNETQREMDRFRNISVESCLIMYISMTHILCICYNTFLFAVS